MAHLKFVNQYTNTLSAAKQFYEEVIGLTNTVPSETWHGYQQALVEFALEPSANRQGNIAKYQANWSNPYLLQFCVDDLGEMRAILERARTANIKVLAEFEETDYGTLSRLVDPDGNFVELIL